MSLAAVRRARGLPLTLLRQSLASCLHQCLLSGGSGGGGGVGSGGTSAVSLPGTASLWRYDSPLLRHLSNTPVEGQVRALALLPVRFSLPLPCLCPADCSPLARNPAWAAGGAPKP